MIGILVAQIFGLRLACSAKVRWSIHDLRPIHLLYLRSKGLLCDHDQSIDLEMTAKQGFMGSVRRISLVEMHKRRDSGWHRLHQVILLVVSSIVVAVVRRQKKEALYLYFSVTVR